MAKILEVESGVDPVEVPVDPEQKKKNDIEEMIQGTMRKAYILGLSNGTRMMCTQLLGKMAEIKNLNAQKQLVVLKKMCLDIMNQSTDNTNKTENTDKENKNDV